MIGLFIGRFQPFHKGHLELIKKALKEVRNLIIVVAIPMDQTSQDPFSAEERKDMIEKALHNEGIMGFVLYTVQDIPSDDEYVQHVRNHVPTFNVVYVGDNKLNEELFKKAGFTVKTCPRFFNIEATKIRKLIVRNDPHWKEMVPELVVEYIENNDLAKKVETP